jgi:hypothetical protein
MPGLEARSFNGILRVPIKLDHVENDLAQSLVLVVAA